MSRAAYRVASWLAVFSFGAEPGHAEPEWCEVLVAAEKVERDNTDGFIAYLGQLLEAQVIGDAELRKIADGLKSGELVNPISDQDTLVSSRLLTHYNGLQERISGSDIDHERLLNWLNTHLENRTRVRDRRNEVREKTESPDQPMDFHRVEPGTFRMGDDEVSVMVTLTDAFELMSTQVTQLHWALIMGENPSVFTRGGRAVEIMVDGESVPIQMQPDHPVDRVSWNRIRIFLSRINDRSNANDPLLFKIIPDHKKGDQYRLPTEAEWEFVAKNRGRAKGRFFFGDNGEDLKKYAWYERNSTESTHPVAQLTPLVIDGKPFYDLHGNVWEWVEDWLGPLPDGHVVNPKGPNEGIFRGLRGGGWSDDGRTSAARNGSSPGEDGGYGVYGFRLVRVRNE